MKTTYRVKRLSLAGQSIRKLKDKLNNRKFDGWVLAEIFDDFDNAMEYIIYKRKVEEPGTKFKIVRNVSTETDMWEE